MFKIPHCNFSIAVHSVYCLSRTVVASSLISKHETNTLIVLQYTMCSILASCNIEILKFIEIWMSMHLDTAFHVCVIHCYNFLFVFRWTRADSGPLLDAKLHPMSDPANPDPFLLLKSTTLLGVPSSFWRGTVCFCHTSLQSFVSLSTTTFPPLFSNSAFTPSIPAAFPFFLPMDCFIRLLFNDWVHVDIQLSGRTYCTNVLGQKQSIRDSSELTESVLSTLLIFLRVSWAAAQIFNYSVQFLGVTNHCSKFCFKKFTFYPFFLVSHASLLYFIFDTVFSSYQYIIWYVIRISFLKTECQSVANFICNDYRYHRPWTQEGSKGLCDVQTRLCRYCYTVTVCEILILVHAEEMCGMVTTS